MPGWRAGRVEVLAGAAAAARLRPAAAGRPGHLMRRSNGDARAGQAYGTSCAAEMKGGGAASLESALLASLLAPSTDANVLHV